MAWQDLDVVRFSMLRFALYRVCLVLCVAGLIMSGCRSGSVPVATPGTSTDAIVTTTVATLKTPAVTSNLGAVVAKLYYAAGGQPSRQQIFYAAPLAPLKGTDGTAVALVASLDAATAQRDQSDGDGNIAISRIPPGHYGLAMSTPRGYIMLTEAPSNKEILFDVVAGQVTDLGKRSILVDKNLVEP
jgi:hypothetical protein